jgi:small-conductance mechanosensitive channel
MAEPTLLHEVVELMREGIAQPRLLWQLAVVAAGLGGGWALARRVRHRIEGRIASESQGPGLRTDVLRFSIAGVRRLAFPVAAMVIIVAGGLALRAAGVVQRPADAQVLRLALTLLVALGGIRLLVYAMRRSLPQAAWLGTFERAIATLVWLGVAAYLTGVLGDAVAALESIRLPIGRSQISVWDLLMAAVSVVVTALTALWLGSTIESRLMRAETLTANSRVVLTRVIKALLLVVAVLLALSTAGIDLTVLSVFGGALGVGLGLGLQRIASNYVSGFIILLDRSLSIGDLITAADKYYGKVTQINTRYTVIKALDGTETILPNEVLVSTPVVNHSYTDRKVRVAIKASVAYSADVDRALAVLVECARSQRRVQPEPPPAAFITGLGADGVEVELGFWILDPEEGTLAIRSEITRLVLRKFAEAGIEIPFPQRDVRIVAAAAAVQALAKGT